MTPQEYVGQRIKHALKANNLKQNDLAEHLGVGKAAISHLINGTNCQDAHLFSIGEFTRVDPYWLKTGSTWSEYIHKRNLEEMQ